MTDSHEGGHGHGGTKDDLEHKVGYNGDNHADFVALHEHHETSYQTLMGHLGTTVGKPVDEIKESMVNYVTAVWEATGKTATGAPGYRTKINEGEARNFVDSLIGEIAKSQKISVDDYWATLQKTGASALAFQIYQSAQAGDVQGLINYGVGQFVAGIHGYDGEKSAAKSLLGDDATEKDVAAGAANLKKLAEDIGRSLYQKSLTQADGAHGAH